jgi:hypothetical protein
MCIGYYISENNYSDKRINNTLKHIASYEEKTLKHYKNISDITINNLEKRPEYANFILNKTLNTIVDDNIKINYENNYLIFNIAIEEIEKKPELIKYMGTNSLDYIVNNRNEIKKIYEEKKKESKFQNNKNEEKNIYDLIEEKKDDLVLMIDEKKGTFRNHYDGFKKYILDLLR